MLWHCDNLRLCVTLRIDVALFCSAISPTSDIVEQPSFKYPVQQAYEAKIKNKSQDQSGKSPHTFSDLGSCSSATTVKRHDKLRQPLSNRTILVHLRYIGGREQILIEAAQQQNVRSNVTAPRYQKPRDGATAVAEPGGA